MNPLYDNYRILCQYCTPHIYIDSKLYNEHIALLHVPSQQEFNQQISANLSSIEEQVEYVLRKVKPAQSNSGLCIQLTMRYFPMDNMNFRIIYDSSTGLIGIEGKDDYMKLASFLRRVGSVSRSDRRIREKYPELDGSPKAKVKREKEEVGYISHYTNSD